MMIKDIDEFLADSQKRTKRALSEIKTLLAENDRVLYNAPRWMRMPMRPNDNDVKKLLETRGPRVGYRSDDPAAATEYNHGAAGSLLHLYQHHPEFDRATGEITAIDCGARVKGGKGIRGVRRYCKRPHLFGASSTLQAAERMKQAFLTDASWGESEEERLDAFESYMLGEKLPSTFCAYSVCYPFEVELCVDRPYCGMRHFAKRRDAHAYSIDLQISDVLNNVRTEYNVARVLESPLEPLQISIAVGRLLKQRGRSTEPYLGELPEGVTLENIDVLSSYLEQVSGDEARRYKRSQSDDAHSGGGH